MGNQVVQPPVSNPLVGKYLPDPYQPTVVTPNQLPSEMSSKVPNRKEVNDSLQKLDELYIVNRTTKSGKLGKLFGSSKTVAAARKCEDEQTETTREIIEVLCNAIEKAYQEDILLDSFQQSKGLCSMCISLLRNPSFFEVCDRAELYQVMMKFLKRLAANATMVSFLSSSLTAEDRGVTCRTLMTSLAAQSVLYKRVESGAEKSSSKKRAQDITEEIQATELVINASSALAATSVPSTSAGSGSSSSSSAVVTAAEVPASRMTTRSMAQAIEQKKGSVFTRKPKAASVKTTFVSAAEEEYVNAMSEYRFGMTELNLVPKWGNQVIQNQARIAKEVATLSHSLPITFDSSIFLRVDESRMNMMKALIIGPADTPYANGCFEFDITLPGNYPQSPPFVYSCINAGGTVRFNPNLYQNGYVCLSLLGTWSGPGWDPSQSTIQQVLVSLQSLVLVRDPYYNEPGYSHYPNPVASNAYSSQIRQYCLQHAILQQLKAPSGVFRDTIRAHFKHKRASVVEQLDEWQKSLPCMQPTVAAIKAQLGAL